MLKFLKIPKVKISVNVFLIRIKSPEEYCAYINPPKLYPLEAPNLEFLILLQLKEK